MGPWCRLHWSHQYPQFNPALSGRLSFTSVSTPGSRGTLCVMSQEREMVCWREEMYGQIHNTNTCISTYEPCGGQCGAQRRLCDGYCITEEEPCGSTCSPSRHYCMQSSSCLESIEKCPCPPNNWGCCMFRDADGSLTTLDPNIGSNPKEEKMDHFQECEQQCDLSDTDPSPYDDCRVEMATCTSWVRQGYCHPSYTHTHQLNSTKCVIKYVDL